MAAFELKNDVLQLESNWLTGLPGTCENPGSWLFDPENVRYEANCGGQDHSVEEDRRSMAIIVRKL